MYQLGNVRFRMALIFEATFSPFYEPNRFTALSSNLLSAAARSSDSRSWWVVYRSTSTRYACRMMGSSAGSTWTARKCRESGCPRVQCELSYGQLTIVTRLRGCRFTVFAAQTCGFDQQFYSSPQARGKSREGHKTWNEVVQNPT
jgi:hypothetical protein